MRLTRVAADDAPQGGVGLERGIDPDRLPLGSAAVPSACRIHVNTARWSPDRSGSASARSSSVPAGASSRPSPRSPAAPPPSATHCRAPNRCPRIGQSAAGNTRRASDSGVPASRRRTPHTALRRSRRTRGSRGPDSGSELAEHSASTLAPHQNILRSSRLDAPAAFSCASSSRIGPVVWLSGRTTSPARCIVSQRGWQPEGGASLLLGLQPGDNVLTPAKTWPVGVKVLPGAHQ